jgi:hypothetical protein
MDKSHTYRLSSSVEKVAEVLKNTDFHLEMDKGRDDANGSAIANLRPGGANLDFTLVTQEYNRTKTGKIDRSGTTEGRTEFHWDDSARTLAWNYTPGKDPGKIEVRGKYTLKSAGSGSELVHDYTINIRIPLIGGQIAKLVNREFCKSFPSFEATLNRHLQG